MLLPRLQTSGGDQAKEDDFLRWVQVCDRPWALAISTPCKFESQQDVRAVGTSRLERRKLGVRVGQPRMALVLSVSPDEPAHPWSPGTSCSHCPPSQPELGPGHSSPDPEST